MTKILNATRQHGALFSSPGKGNEEFKFLTPPGEKFHSCRLTVLETHMAADAKVAAQPSQGDSGELKAVVEWQCEGSAMVKYQLEAFSIPEASSTSTGDGAATRQMTDFLPSKNGFHFDNQYESVPSLKLIGDLRYGDASKGLCGGMVYASLDYFMGGLDIPIIPKEDLSLRYGSPLHGPIFDYIGKRLFNSFNVPAGVWTYIELMYPGFPDFQARKKKMGLDPVSRAWRMVRQEWPVIKSRLDIGQPCPLGLICVKSKELNRLGENHQVLAYGYDQVGNDLTLFIYDPNFHDDDSITLSLSLADPENETPVYYSGPQMVYCFFHTDYTFSMPPANASVPGRIILFEDENYCGKSIDVVHANPDLRSLKEGNFDDRTSSFAILTGNWSFYQKTGFEQPFMHGKEALVLGPGTYKNVVELGMQDNQISSLKEVAIPKED
jgi:Beta/Gamma crystallin